MCIQLPLPLHGRICTGGRLFTIGPSSTAVKLSFVLIVSLATLPFCVRYSCVTVSVEASVQSDSDKPGSAATGSSAGAAFGFGSIGSHGSSSSDIKISGNRSFVWFKGHFLSEGVGTC